TYTQSTARPTHGVSTSDTSRETPSELLKIKVGRNFETVGPVSPASSSGSTKNRPTSAPIAAEECRIAAPRPIPIRDTIARYAPDSTSARSTPGSPRDGCGPPPAMAAVPAKKVTNVTTWPTTSETSPTTADLAAS